MIVESKLTDGRFIGTYHRLLRSAFLDPLARWIGDAEEYALPPKHCLRRWFGFFPWTPGSYTFCLKLAFMYPLGALMVTWMLSGVARLGSWEIIIIVAWPWRVLTLTMPIIMSQLLFFSSTSIDRNFIKSAPTRSIAFLLTFVLILTTPFYITKITMFDTTTIAVAILTSFLCIIYAKFVIGISLFDKLVAPWHSIIDKESETALSKALNTVVIDHGNAPILESFSVGLRLAAVLIFSLALLAGTAVLFWWSAEPRGGVLILLFLGTLPVLNAFWDWLSLGASRWLLGEIVLGRHKGAWPVLWGLFDLVLAGVFLLAIVLSITAAFALFNWIAALGGHPAPLDLVSLFADLRREPTASRHWWLYFMFLSTLVPTLIHFVAAGGAVMQWLAQPLRPWRERAAAQMQHDVTDRLGAQLYLTLVPVIGISVPVLLLMLAVWWLPRYAASPARWLLDVAQSTAMALGGMPPAP